MSFDTLVRWAGFEFQEFRFPICFGFRISDFGFGAICGVLVLGLFLTSTNCPAQPQSELAQARLLPPAEGERVAREFLANLLSQKPEQNSTSTGVLKIRGADHHQREVPVRFEMLVTPTNWLNSYETVPADHAPGQKLTIVHSDARPDEYLLTATNGPDPTNAGPRKLTDNELMFPFAGSDFCAVDLSLVFLHWPQQRVLKKEIRQHLFCDVLQSTNPHPTPGAYSRVVSWIAVNRPEEIVIVHADAYDFRDKLLKEFEPKKVLKINGAWQLEEMELRNRQTDTRSRIEFNLNPG
jgi:hypothetical protein